MASPILKTTPTIYGSSFRNDNDLGIDHSPSSNTTINTKFGIHENTAVTAGSRMAIGYYSIGNGALRPSATASDGSFGFGSIPHLGKNAWLYNALPFVLKHTSEDLSPAERANYAMRVPVELDGEYYWAYYLRKIVIAQSENTFSEITVADGRITATEPFVPTIANLSPTKPDFVLSEAIQTDGSYYQVIKPLDISFTENDSVLFSEVIDLLYEDPANRGIISEIGLVAGYPNTVPLLDENKAPISGNYTELLKAITTDIINVEALNVNASSEGFDFTIDLGSTIPKYHRAT